MKKITLLFAAIFASVALNAQCVEYVDGPYIDFNNENGGAPSPGGPAFEITAFEIWKSEAYILDNIIAGESYIFSACNGAGAGTWAIDYTVGLFDGTAGFVSVDAFGLDEGSTCEITFTATESGTYLIAINEAGNCGVPGQIDNGFPKIAWTEALSIDDQEIAGFNYFYNLSSKQLTLVANEAFSNISLYNLLGQEVIAQKLSATNEVINLSSLKNGVYLANVTANGQTTTVKIAKR